MARLARWVLACAWLLSSWSVDAQSAQAPRTYLALTTVSTAAQACSAFVGEGLSCLTLAPKQEKIIDSIGKLDVMSYAFDCNGESSSQLIGSFTDWLLGRSVCGVVLLGSRHIDTGIDVPTVRFVIVHTPSDRSNSASVTAADDGTLAELFASAFKTPVSITAPNSDAAQRYMTQLGSERRQALREKIQSLEFATQAQDAALAYYSSQDAYRKAQAAYVDFCRRQIDDAQSLLDRYRQAWQTADVQDRVLQRQAEDIIKKCRDQIDSQRMDTKHLTANQ